MELNLVMLNDNQVSTLWAPLYIFVALEGARNDALVTIALVGRVPLEVHVLANLAEELLTLGVQDGVTQLHQRVASSCLLDRVTGQHDLLEIVDLARREQVVLIERVIIDNGGTELGLLF